MPVSHPSRVSPKAVIIGASSGIGHALARQLSSEGYTLGLTARRIDLLKKLQSDLPHPSFIQAMDISKFEESVKGLNELISKMGGMDLLVINSGINRPNPDLEWGLEWETIQTNAAGFMALAGFGARYFIQQRSGHLAAVSSIAALLGSPRSPAYSASKAFMATYMEGLSFKLRPLGIHVTDIRPGFVETAMIAGARLKFWVASCEKAAVQISRALKARKSVVYVTRRWALIAFLYGVTPKFFIRFLHQILKR